MKLTHLLSILALLTLGGIPAAADPPGKKDDFAGTYFAGLPERAEILQLHDAAAEHRRRQLFAGIAAGPHERRNDVFQQQRTDLQLAGSRTHIDIL